MEERSCSCTATSIPKRLWGDPKEIAGDWPTSIPKACCFQSVVLPAAYARSAQSSSFDLLTHSCAKRLWGDYKGA